MRVLLITLLLCLSFTASADYEQCLQSSARTEPCPNQLYKSHKTMDMNGQPVTKLICICLTDFKPLFDKPQTEADKIKQKMAIAQIEADTAMTAEQLRALIQK